MAQTFGPSSRKNNHLASTVSASSRRSACWPASISSSAGRSNCRRSTEQVFSWLEFRIQTGAHITWFGAIFAGVYALLYARFSSQWTYLAGVYNQIKSAELRKDTDDAALAEWKAGFIEDCQDLHLLRKPMFASIVHAWLNSGELGLPVRDCFKSYTPGGADRLLAIQDQVTLVVTRSGGSALSGDSNAECPNNEHLYSAIGRRAG